MGIKRLLSVAVIGVSFVGCGGVKDVKETVPASAIETNVRKTLEEYEKTGQLGSSMTSLESDINGIKSTDAAKADALTKDYRELQGMTDSAQIKAKAKEMLGKL